MTTIFTIGHGTRATGELAALLLDADVELLIDVRRFPGSKRSPHLARVELERSLPERGIAYEWWGEVLGGRRHTREASRHAAWRNASFQGYADHMDTEYFRRALHHLERRAEERRSAIMCAETVWWRCHRRLISDALLLLGHEVIHLGMGSQARQHHPLHPAAREGEDGYVVYDVGVDRTLGI